MAFLKFLWGISGSFWLKHRRKLEGPFDLWFYPNRSFIRKEKRKKFNLNWLDFTLLFAEIEGENVVIFKEVDIGSRMGFHCTDKI